MIATAPSTPHRPALATVTAYAAFLAFCACSALRDVLHEHLAKKSGVQAHPALLIFVYSLSTQIIAALVLLCQRCVSAPPVVPLRTVARDVVLRNAYTLISYGAYFWAISTALGATMNSIIEYGTTPLVMAAVGATLLGEHLDRRYAFTTAAC